MDRFLTRYVLAPVVRAVQLEALAANQRALLVLREGGADVDLADALAAGSACWWLLRPALPKGRRKSVRDSLARQRRLLARSPLPRRKLARTLERQSAWLGELAAAPTPADRIVLDRVVRAYRKARREARRDPASPEVRKRLGRLVRCEELLLGETSPMTGGAAARRRYLERFERAVGPARTEDASRRKPDRGRPQRQAVRQLAARAFEATPEAYGAWLPRTLWARRRPQPVALASRGGQGGQC